jgi:hypothetical protein
LRSEPALDVPPALLLASADAPVPPADPPVVVTETTVPSALRTVVVTLPSALVTDVVVVLLLGEDDDDEAPLPPPPCRALRACVIGEDAAPAEAAAPMPETIPATADPMLATMASVLEGSLHGLTAYG